MVCMAVDMVAFAAAPAAVPRTFGRFISRACPDVLIALALISRCTSSSLLPSGGSPSSLKSPRRKKKKRKWKKRV